MLFDEAFKQFACIKVLLALAVTVCASLNIRKLNAK